MKINTRLHAIPQFILFPLSHATNNPLSCYLPSCHNNMHEEVCHAAVVALRPLTDFMKSHTVSLNQQCI